MSDARKPGGSRDISDLKARLGLKKGAAAPATGQPRATGQTGGVVAPPGMNLPPPPGVHQPAPPPMPNAADDPFGAMNAMAAVGTVQRAPEIVIVNDGRPVENVGAESHGASIARIAIPAVLALLVGIAVGKIGGSASSYNAGLSDVKQILGAKGTPSTVVDLKQQLSQLDTLLDEAKTKNAFRPDKDLDNKLKAAAKAFEVKKEIVYRAKQNAVDADVSGQILAFYAGVAELKAMIDQHIKSAEYDDKAFAKAKEKQSASELKEADNAYLNGQLRYAVFISAPTDDNRDEPFGAKLVEIGPPYCGDKVASSGKCSDGSAPNGFAYRTEPGGTFIQGQLATGGGDSVPAKKLVQLLPGGVRDSLVKGADGVASEIYYQKRMRAIYERIHGLEGRTKGLLDEGNKLETKLQTESNKSSKFSFFM